MQKQGPKPRDTSCSPNMPKLASLNIWEIRKHYVEDVYRVLAVYVNGKVDMYKPYPSDLGSKTWKRFPFQSFAFAGGFKAMEMFQMTIARNVQSFSLVVLLESFHVDMGSTTWKV